MILGVNVVLVVHQLVHSLDVALGHVDLTVDILIFSLDTLHLGADLVQASLEGLVVECHGFDPVAVQLVSSFNAHAQVLGAQIGHVVTGRHLLSHDAIFLRRIKAHI